MKSVFAASAALLFWAVLPSEVQACNIRGDFCGQPYWAANAFAHPRDRVSEGALPYVRRATVVYYVRKKKHR